MERMRLKRIWMMFLSALLVLALFPALTAKADDLSVEQKFEVLKRQNIFTGFNDGSSRLWEPMSREQFATIIYRLWELPDVNTTPTYYDVLRTRWSFNEVEAVTRAGFMGGVGNGKFWPDHNVTIEQLAAVFVRAYGSNGQSADRVYGNVSAWARNEVGIALRMGIIPAKSDYTVDAPRSLLVEAAYAVYQKLHPENLSVKRIEPLNNNKLLLQLNEAVDSISEDQILIRDNDGDRVFVRDVIVSQDGKQVTVITEEQKGNVKYTLTAGGKTFIYTTLREDDDKPYVESVVKISDSAVRVTFNEPVDLDTAEDEDNYYISDGIRIQWLEVSKDREQVTLYTSDQMWGAMYRLTVRDIEDLAGNVMVTKDNLYFGNRADSSRPYLLSAVSTSDNTVQLVFSEKVNPQQAMDKDNYDVNNGLYIQWIELKQDGITVVLHTSQQFDGVVYSLSVRDIADLWGNEMYPRDNLYFVNHADRTRPTVSLVDVKSNSTVIVRFSEKVGAQEANRISNYAIDHGLDVLKAHLESDGKTVTLTTSKQQDRVIYTLTIEDIEDLAGNEISSNTRLTFAGVAPVSPGYISLDSIKAISANELNIRFDHKVSAGNLSKLNVKITSENGPAISMANWKYFIRQKDDQTAFVQFRTDESNPTLFRQGGVYSATVTGLPGLILNNEANEMLFAGTGVLNKAPYVTKAVPVNATSIKVSFSELVKNVSRAAFVIREENGDRIDVTGVQQVDTGDVVNQVVLNLGTELESGKTYIMSFNSGITDAAGWNGLKIKEGDDPYTVRFTGVNAENKGPSIAAVAAMDRYNFDILFTEPVLHGDEGRYSLYNVTDQETLGIAEDSQAGYVASGDKKKVSVHLFVGETDSFQSGKLYKLVYNKADGRITDLQGKAFDASNDGDEFVFAGVDSANSRPHIESVSAQRKSITITMSESISGYSNQTNYFDIVANGKTVRARSGSIKGRTITLNVPNMAEGKTGTIAISATGIKRIKDQNQQQAISKKISFRVQ